MKKIENMVVGIVESLLSVQKDVRKFDHGNQRAGVRVRKVMQEIKSDSQSVRDEIQAIKRSRKKNAKKDNT